MGIKILWYLTAPDGQVPWEADGRWQTGYGHLQQLAGSIDKLGYYGALLATGADEVNVLAASVLSVTQRMKFIAAVHPGLIAPAKLAQIAQTINRFSGNRLIYNAVNGNDRMLSSQGQLLAHDERYDYSAEYWDAFRKLYGGSAAGYDGKYIQIAPRPPEAGGGSQRGARPPAFPPFELWGAGTSPAGVAHSVQTLDVYLSFADTPQRLGDKFRRVAAEAAKLGRSFAGFGTRLQIIVRETEEEAWEYAQYLVSRTSVEYARQSIERQLPPGETFDAYVSPDEQVNRNLAQIRAGRLPKARDYEFYPNLWTGPALHGFNVLGPAQGTTLVGSAENVAARLREFQAQGVDTFILSGWPLIEEAYRVADLLFPLLELDHGFEVPLLSPGRQAISVPAPAPAAPAAHAAYQPAPALPVAALGRAAMDQPWNRRDFLRNMRGGLLLGGGLALGGGALLAGCGQRAGASASASASVQGVAGGALDAPRRGGRLRLGIVDGNQSGNLDVHKPVGSGIIRGFALYSKLWEWSEHMTPELALAEEVSINANASAWTIRLRKGLEFHNGKTISADDLIFSARRLSDPKLASPYASLVKYLDRDNIVKLDERTVRIPIRDGLGFLALPDGWVNFGGIVPTDYDPVTNPVGAGPYRLKQFTPGQRSLFTRFENYFKPGQPYADELEIIEFKDQVSRVAALQAGQIDTAYAISPEQIAPLRASGRADVVISHSHGWHGFEMNVEAEPFRDVRVRQAFRLLADRQELVDRALGGQGRIANDLYSPLDPTFNHAIAQRRQDLAQARSLLRAAGKENLALEFVAGPGGSAAAQVFANQAKLAGIDLRVRQADAATFNGPQRDSWAISNTYKLGGEFLHTATNTDGPIAATNKSHFNDARFSELFRAAMAEPDLARRTALVHEAQQIQHDQGGLLIWGFADVADGVSKRVGGVTPERSHFPTWRFDKIWLRS